jgi:HAD superfamily hydrolase (TIGR01509 family)
MGRLNAILWDMDGVMVDSGEFHYQAWMKVLEDYEIEFSPDIFRTTFGMNNTGLLAKITGRVLEPALVAEISNRKEAQFRQDVRGKVDLLPGVRDWLQQAKDYKLSQAVASSAPQDNIDLLLDELDVCHFFKAVVSAEHMPGKPDPAVFIEAARRLVTAPENCLVIEDAIAGVEAAHRAGMKCLAVTNTNPAEVLKKADCVVDSLEQVDVSILVAAYFD